MFKSLPAAQEGCVKKPGRVTSRSVDFFTAQQCKFSPVQLALMPGTPVTAPCTVFELCQLIETQGCCNNAIANTQSLK
ncbi:hypothetical protein DXN05_15735 [Deminuibacter soli]|uniref:Uncharacterized protein n=1 Tax=Deminuibacter soli TaxID=2291815 RepID=A0A3E1NHP9_9BACT|nr:hypothetical protein DXN05_15735 [Deminuibacter soli]